jgi:uncharacterized protein YuzE
MPDQPPRGPSSVTISFSLDRAVDAAYLHLADSSVEYERTVVVPAEDLGGRTINIDLDKDGRLIGLELPRARTTSG